MFETVFCLIFYFHRIVGLCHKYGGCSCKHLPATLVTHARIVQLLNKNITSYHQKTQALARMTYLHFKVGFTRKPRNSIFRLLETRIMLDQCWRSTKQACYRSLRCVNPQL